jgi:hypothetical protein
MRSERGHRVGWPKSLRVEHEVPRPRNPKGRAHNPNYRIATGTLICVKAVSTPNTLLAIVRSDCVCRVWHRDTGTACVLILVTLGLHVRT